MTLFTRVFVPAIAAISLVACNKIPGINGTGNVAAAFPKTLALASPTQKPTTRTTDGKDYAAKTAKVAKLLNGTAITDCAFAINLASTTGNAACYGPSLSYANHPQSATTGPAGDVGIFTENDADGTACAAAQLNQKVNGIGSQVDTAVLAMASLMCIAKVNGHELPATGASLDLKADVSNAFSVFGVEMKVSGAAIARDADTTDGLPVYVTTFTGTQSTQTLALRMKHVPTAADNSTFRGKLSFAVADTTNPTLGNCPHDGSIPGQTSASSIAYEQLTANSLNIRLQRAHFCGNDADPYVSATNFTVDQTKTYNASTRPKGWADNFNYALFSVNPTDGSGNYRFGWQAGYNDGNTRALNVSLASSAGTVAGCGYFGFGADAATGVASAGISKFICNWASGTGPDHTGTTDVQRQCMAKDSSGKFLSTTAQLRITYAPTNACNAGASFIMTPSGGTPISGPITNNLYPLASITDLTAPLAPTEVD